MNAAMHTASPANTSELTCATTTTGSGVGDTDGVNVDEAVVVGLGVVDGPGLGTSPA